MQKTAMLALVCGVLWSSDTRASENDTVALVRAAALSGATVRERELLAPEFERYLAQGGDLEHASWLVGTGMEQGCRGLCLPVMLRGLSDTMACGVQDRMAVGLVSGVLEQQIARRDRLGARWTSDQLAAHMARGLSLMIDVQCAARAH